VQAGDQVLQNIVYDIIRPALPPLLYEQVQRRAYELFTETTPADGLFAATVNSDFIVFDTAGRIQWSAPGLYPVLATAGGGLIAAGAGGNYAFDVDGNASGRVGSVGTQSWLGSVYEYGSVLRVATAPIVPGGLWPQAQGNPSGTGARVFRTLESAAISAMNFVWPQAGESQWEFGGRVCRSNANTFYTTGPVTEFDTGQVDVLAFVKARCRGENPTVGMFHTHPHRGVNRIPLAH
jgi:hypothetical protein